MIGKVITIGEDYFTGRFFQIDYGYEISLFPYIDIIFKKDDLVEVDKNRVENSVLFLFRLEEKSFTISFDKDTWNEEEKGEYYKLLLNDKFWEK